jgi:starch synthase
LRAKRISRVPAIYGPPGSDYPDNARRYACFTVAALEALPTIAGNAPVLLHTHDWHTALAPVYLRTRFAGDERYQRVKTVLSVHNAGFQGTFPPATVTDLGLPASLFNWRQLEWYGQFNMLKGGLVFADAVTTVSPTHAHELRTAAGGFGLDGVFVSLGSRFVGIANGIDQILWDPATDPILPANYSVDALAGKLECREALQREMGLRPTDEMPIVAMSARLVAQKGLDLILGNPNYFAFDAQFIFLGAGEPRYEAALQAIADRAPNRIKVNVKFSDAVEHRLLGRRRHVPDAIAIRAVRVDADARPALWHDSHRATRWRTGRYDRRRRNGFSVRRLYAGGLHASRDARDESIRGAGRLARDDARGDDARLRMGTVGRRNT